MRNFVQEHTKVLSEFKIEETDKLHHIIRENSNGFQQELRNMEIMIQDQQEDIDEVFDRERELQQQQWQSIKK